jgi:copper homeostasis protein
MIRPRIGPFVYSESELCVMEQDILAFKSEGVHGVVFGCLTEEGEVDMRACDRYVLLIFALRSPAWPV